MGFSEHVVSVEVYQRDVTTGMAVVCLGAITSKRRRRNIVIIYL